MALALAKPVELLGVPTPRLSPPVPAHSRLTEYGAAAQELGITLYPWQKIAARYITAVIGERWQYREVCVVVARQNGKTELLIPRVLMGLRAGESILHTAQNRDIPRKTFLRIAALIERTQPDYAIRRANGQEEISAPNGGRYKLIAPNSSSRGETADLVLIDEVREQHDLDLMDAMLPTTIARPNAQIVYLSNAGFDESIVLNDLRRRADTNEPRLAYLEWSAAPERTIADRAGWAEANPALGHGQLTLEGLEYFYANRPAPSFETEHLCRWVASMQPKLVSEADWMKCRGDVSTPAKPAVAFNMAPDGKRASASMAWQMADGRVALVELREAEGNPIDVDRLGRDIRQLALQHRARQAAYASWTDVALARYLPKAKAVDGKEFANACADFVRMVQSGRLVWEGADHITEELGWTARKPHESGTWTAVPASPERPVTSVLAAIRAVSLASALKPPLPRIG